MGCLSFIVFVASMWATALSFGDTCKANGKKLCVSPECVTTSNYILSMMDRTVDPCTNMYQYSCGAWQRKVHIPEDEMRWSTMTRTIEENTLKLKKILEADGNSFKGVNSTAIRKLKDYFDTCLDTTTIEMRGRTPFIELIDKLGSWTVTSRYNKPWNNQTWSFQTAMERALAIGGTKPNPPFEVPNPPFFNVFLNNDLQNSSNYVIYLQPSGMILRDPLTYIFGREAYLNATIGVAKYLGGDSANAKQKLIDVIDFESKLASAVSHSLTNEEWPKNMFHKKKLSEAQVLIGNALDLKKYLKSSFNVSAITDDLEINVVLPNYLTFISSLIDSTSPEIVNNYIVNMVLFDTLVIGSVPATPLPAALNQEVFKLIKGRYGTSRLPPRWKQCLTESELAMGFASSALFDDENFPQESNDQVTQLFKSMKLEILDDISTVSWLDNSTRENLRVKAKALDYRIGYPKWTSNPASLDAYYQSYKVTRGKGLENLMNFFKFQSHVHLNLIGKPVNKKRWQFRPDLVNAYYSPFDNQLFIPSGYVQQPSFSPVFPPAYNYGSLGSTVGHEITHGFDNKGRVFDETGALSNMWTKKSEQGFNTAAQCIINQYNKFSFLGKKLQGDLELSENIADNGGLKLAYKAMQKTNIKENQLPGLNFTKEQLFFIGFGQKFCANYREQFEQAIISSDVHPPSNFRVLGTIANSRDFGKAFNCPVGTPMNPAHKCEVW